MRTSFFGLHVATSAMNTARANLSTIGHNIANAETPGFSRQVAVQQASQPLRGSLGRGMIGTGSFITSIVQIRNQFLDTKYWNQHATIGQFNKKHDIFTLIQGIMHEGENVGLTHEVNSMFSRMSDLATNAHDLTYRRNFISAFESMAVTLNSQYSQLAQQKADLNLEVAVTVGAINSLGRQIQALNRQITVLELDGTNANDLRDQRALLIDELSRYVNIEVKEIETNPEFAAGRVTDRRASHRELIILIDGNSFISHFDLNEIEVRSRVFEDGPHAGTSVKRNPEEVGGMYDVYWRNGAKFNIYSPTLRGELGALISLRDGNGGNFADFSTTAVPTAVPPKLAPVLAPGSPPILTMYFADVSRVDLGNTGVITIQQPGGAPPREIRYSNFTLEFDEVVGSSTFGKPIRAIFELHEGDDPITDDFNGAQSITVGKTTTYMGVPYFMSRLNELARTLAAAFNEGRRLDGSQIAHITGHFSLGPPDQTTFDLNGNAGGLLLGNSGSDADWNWNGAGVFNYFNITASNLSVNPAILRDPRLLALAASHDNLPSDNRVIASWASINTYRGLFAEGRLGDFIASVTGDLGITGRQAENYARSYSELIVAIDNQRRSVSGVSIDEEVAFMIQHQIVFQAAARLFSVIDGIYDTLINRVGRW